MGFSRQPVHQRHRESIAAVSTDLNNHFGPEIFEGYVVAAFRYDNSGGGPTWHVTSYPNAQNVGRPSDFLVTGETFRDAISSVSANGTMSVRPRFTGPAQVSPQEKAAVLKAINKWEQDRQ